VETVAITEWSPPNSVFVPNQELSNSGLLIPFATTPLPLLAHIELKTSTTHGTARTGSEAKTEGKMGNPYK